MTPRQKEFIRHYAMGFSAPKAAIAAGYAKSTSEHNAALILQSPAVAKKLNKLRERSQQPYRHQIATAIAQLSIAAGQEEDNRKLAALHHQIRGWINLALKLGIPPTLSDEIFADDDDKTDIENHIGSTDQNHLQHNENQQDNKEIFQHPHNQNHSIKEIENLPDGTPAYDAKPAPKKPVPPPIPKHTFHLVAHPGLKKPPSNKENPPTA